MIINIRKYKIHLMILALALVAAAIHALLFPSGAVQTNASAEEKKYYVVLDAGHGGTDSGTVAKDGTYEKDINLGITLKLQEVFKAHGFEVVMTRTQDNDTDNSKKKFNKKSDIYNRVYLANSYPSAPFISIHTDYFANAKYSGAQVFYSTKNKQSAAFAKSVQQSIKQSLQYYNNRTEKKAGSGIYIMNHVVSPAILVECGFLSNAGELWKLKDESYQTQMAFAIYLGCMNFLSQEAA